MITLYIYLFGVVGNLGTVLVVFLGVFAIVMGTIHLGVAIEDGTDGLMYLYKQFTFLKTLWISAFTAVFLIVFMPTPKTLIMMAASEVGQSVFKDVQTAPITAKSMKFLEEYIDRETSKLLEEK